MVYFLVNNNFHLDLDNRLSDQLKGLDRALIQVPYSLNVIENHPLYSRIYCFDHKLHASLTRFVFKPTEIRKVKRRIDNVLSVTGSDILLVHNEIDLTNQYIIQKFFEKKARVFLLEDGTSTMCTYNLRPEMAPFVERLKFFILRHFFGFKYSRVFTYGDQVLPVMNDQIFQGLIVNFGDSVLRKIPVIKLRHSESRLNLPEDCATIYSQPLYLWYMSEDQYLQLIKEMLEISKNFRISYFKFHPSDIERVKSKIKKLLEKTENTFLIEENEIAENLIVRYPARYAITFNSTAALNLIAKGVIPVFANTLLTKKYPSPSFIQFDQFLKCIKCNTPAELSQIKPGFCAFEDYSVIFGSKSIAEIIK